MNSTLNYIATFSLSNSDEPFLVHKGAWKTTSDINCHGQSYNCLKQCYDYQQHKMCETCDTTGAHEIIIQCSKYVCMPFKEIL